MVLVIKLKTISTLERTFDISRFFAFWAAVSLWFLVAAFSWISLCIPHDSITFILPDVCSVTVELLPGIIFVDQRFLFLRVMDCRVGHHIRTDELGTLSRLVGTSRSFWRSLLGFAFHDSRVWPFLSWSFSSRLLRCRGTSTKLASTIYPVFAKILWSSKA
jgi:hypothetical protein